MSKKDIARIVMGISSSIMFTGTTVATAILFALEAGGSFMLIVDVVLLFVIVVTLLLMFGAAEDERAAEERLKRFTDSINSLEEEVE